jgi:hypothetical protein
MVDVNPNEDNTVIIVEDEDEFLFPSGAVGTSLEELPDDEEVPIPVAQDEKTIVIGVVSPGPRGADGQAGINGADGADGREVELSADATYIKWRLVGDPDWENLVLLDDLQGPPGADGNDGGTFARGMPRTGSTDLLGLPTTNVYAVSTMTAGTYRSFNSFEVDAPISVKAFDTEVVFTGSETTLRVGIIAADTRNQPTGAVLAQANLTISSTGPKRQTITPVTLQPGRYLLMHQGQNAGSVTLRSFRAATRAVNTTMGTAGLVERYRYNHSSGQALDASPWTQLVLQNFGQSLGVLMEYEYV